MIVIVRKLNGKEAAADGAYAKELAAGWLVCAQSTRPAYLNFLSSFFIIQSTPGG
jgi:hypothetical protein